MLYLKNLVFSIVLSLSFVVSTPFVIFGGQSPQPTPGKDKRGSGEDLGGRQSTRERSEQKSASADDMSSSTAKKSAKHHKAAKKSAKKSKKSAPKKSSTDAPK